MLNIEINSYINLTAKNPPPDNKNVHTIIVTISLPTTLNTPLFVTTASCPVNFANLSIVALDDTLDESVK